MRCLITILTLFICSQWGISQETVIDTEQRDPITYQHNKGDKILNVGVGLINPTEYAYSVIGGSSGGGSPSPSINAAFDYGISQHLSIGAFANYYRVTASSTIDLSTIGDIVDQVNEDPLCATQCLLGLNFSSNCICSTDVEERVNVMSVGGKLTLRRPFTPEFDTYASTYLGYSFNKRKTITESALNGILDVSGSSVSVPSFIYFGVIGARYFITPSLAVYGEFGYSNVHLLQLGASYRLGY